MPEGRSERAAELLRAAIALADDLLLIPAAAILGAKGGKATLAKRAGLFPTTRSEAQDPRRRKTAQNRVNYISAA